jgi:hypothetical protein
MARIQSAVAWALKVPAGRYTHIAQSLHMYESDTGRADLLVRDPEPLAHNDPTIAPLLAPRWEVASNVPTERWKIMRAAAEMATRGMPTLNALDFGWYADHLVKHKGYDYYCETCHYYLPQPELVCQALTPLVP